MRLSFRHSIAAAALASLPLIPAFAAARDIPQPFMTGNQWLGLYQSGEAGKEAAAAYVAGYVDGVQAAEATAQRKRFCVPDDVTELELADIVAAYVSGKSVFRQMGAPFVIDGALKDRFRC
jgi:hypothetical protein